jgi:hypothetical protein
MNVLPLSLVRLPVALIGAVVLLALGAMPASARQPAFCRGDRVPEEYFGQVAFVPKSASIVKGGYLYTRLFNGLGRPTSYALSYWVQKYADGAWVPVPSTTPPEGAEPIYPPASARRVGARSIGPCIRFKMDAQGPGRYRLIAEVFIDPRPGAKSRYRAAEFRVR